MQAGDNERQDRKGKLGGLRGTLWTWAGVRRAGGSDKKRAWDGWGFPGPAVPGWGKQEARSLGLGMRATGGQCSRAQVEGQFLWSGGVVGCLRAAVGSVDGSL